MSKDILLSIIIPVYNTEEYISKCLDSIIESDISDIEVIIVNDGSRDGSLKICESYASKIPYIRIISQQNRGLSAARNVGVTHAVGKYISYIDSDDFVKPKLFSQMISYLKLHSETELFVADFNMVRAEGDVFFEKKIVQIGERTVVEEGLGFLPQMLEKRQCFWNVWRYVYRRDFLEKHNITFKEGYLCEDLDYTAKVLMAEPKTVFVYFPYYCYRVSRKNSLMNHTTVKRISDTVEILCKNIADLEKSNFEWKQKIIEQYQFELILTMAQLFEVSPNERQTVRQVFEEHIAALKVGEDILSHSFYHLISVVGIWTVSFALAVLKRIKRMMRKRWKSASCFQ